MKKAAKILSVALVAAMALTFSACSGNKNTPAPATPTPAPTQAAQATATQADTSSPANTTPAGDINPSGDTTSPYTVSMYVDGDDQPAGVQGVNDAMAQYLSDTYGLTNTSINLQFVIWGTYETVLNPMLASGQQFDLAWTSGWWGFDYTQNMPTGAYLDWQPYLAQVPQYQQMLAPYVDGLIGYCNSWAPKDANGSLIAGLYMVPVFKEWAGASCVIVNTTSADQYGIDYSNINSIDDLTPLAAQYHAANPNGVTAIVQSGGLFTNSPSNSPALAQSGQLNIYFDNLNDKYISTWDDPVWQKAKTLSQQWYAAGYIPDSNATDSSIGSDGDFLFTFNVTAPPEIANPQDAMQNDQRGYAQVRIPLTMPVLGIGNMYGNAFCLSKTSGNPDRASLVYMLTCVDPVLTNLWDFGVEGVNYDLDENGQVVPNSDMSYNVADRDYELGSEFLRLSTAGEPASIGPILIAWNESAFQPKNDGFAFLMNTADINNTQAAYGYDYATLTALVASIGSANNMAIGMGTLSDDQIQQLITQLTNAGWAGYVQNYNDWYQQWKADPIQYVADHS